MKKQEILEGNKLIAEFIGFFLTDKRKRKDQIYHTTGKPFIGKACVVYNHSPEPEIEYKSTFRCSEMLFHSSWDWFIPVVKKLWNMENPFDEDENYDNWLEFQEKQIVLIANLEEFDILIEYKEVVEFLKWYNKQ